MTQLIAHRSGAHRIAAALGLALAVLMSASCAAGQHAATSEEVSVVDATNGSVGSIKLAAVAIQPPAGSSYAAGSNAELALVIVNQGTSADTLSGVSSPAYSGWGIVDTAAASTTAVSSVGTPTSIAPGTSLRLGLSNLSPSAPTSPKTLVLSSLAKKSSPLFPGSSVRITFSFARAGATTLTVPVQLTSAPNQSTIPAPSGSASEG